MGQRVAPGRVPPACGSCDQRNSRCNRREQAWGLITRRWHPLTIETRQGLLHQPLPAKDGEGACGFQPFVVLSLGLPGAVIETKGPLR
jgi:hypothetical protein